MLIADSRIMKRKFTSYPINNFAELKTKMLNWSKQFSIFCLLDNHQYSFQPSFECLLGVGSLSALEASAGHAFAQLHDFLSDAEDWMFGHFSYDLKNEIDNL